MQKDEIGRGEGRREMCAQRRGQGGRLGHSGPPSPRLRRDSLLCAAWFARCARLAPLRPLSYALRASARRDAFLVPPPHLEMRNEYPFYLSEPEYFTRTRWRIWSSEERVAGEQARTEIPLTSILCRIRQRRLVRLGSPQGERRGFDVDKATTGRGAHQTCLFTKRTHRFFGIFSMQMALNTLVAAAISERNRWVRFGKRTHREGVLRGYLRI